MMMRGSSSPELADGSRNFSGRCTQTRRKSDKQVSEVLLNAAPIQAIPRSLTSQDVSKNVQPQLQIGQVLTISQAAGSSTGDILGVNMCCTTCLMPGSQDSVFSFWAQVTIVWNSEDRFLHYSDKWPKYHNNKRVHCNKLKSRNWEHSHCTDGHYVCR